MKIILAEIYALAPARVVLMISPKELIDSKVEKEKIFSLFKQYPNLYLFSPHTNSPLGGFYQDTIVRNFPNHFGLPLTKDVLFGPKDAKVRRVNLAYESQGMQPFVTQITEMGFVIKDKSHFRNTFTLWDTTQIYQKSFKAGTFGQINFSSLLGKNNSLAVPKNSTLLVGTFDEFSIHISPSVFDLFGNLSKDNFADYFYPTNETAANVLNLFTTGQYVKFQGGTPTLVVVYLICLFLTIFNKIRIIIKISIILSLPILLIVFNLLLDKATDYFIDLSQSVLFLLIVQYFSIPYLFYLALKSSENSKNDLINSARVDALFSLAERMAHDVRSPLSAINIESNK